MKKALSAACALFAIGTLAGTTAQASTPGWCQHADLKPSESQICESERLSTLDSVLNTAYRRALFDSSVYARSLRRMQREWLRSRNACGYSGHCIEREYHDQISFLETFFRN